MNTMHDRIDASAPWRAQAAYLYLLDLDGLALAWEYLRRHPGYRTDWLALGRRVEAERWGLRCRRRPAARCAPREPSMGAWH